jgi:hypothetical protein
MNDAGEDDLVKKDFYQKTDQENCENDKNYLNCPVYPELVICIFNPECHICQFVSLKLDVFCTTQLK